MCRFFVLCPGIRVTAALFLFLEHLHFKPVKVHRLHKVGCLEYCPGKPLQILIMLLQQHRSAQIQLLAEGMEDIFPACKIRRPGRIKFSHGLTDCFMLGYDFSPNPHSLIC